MGQANQESLDSYTVYPYLLGEMKKSCEQTRRRFLKGIAAGVILVGGGVFLVHQTGAQLKGTAGGEKGAAGVAGGAGAVDTTGGRDSSPEGSTRSGKVGIHPGTE